MPLLIRPDHVVGTRRQTQLTGGYHVGPNVLQTRLNLPLHKLGRDDMDALDARRVLHRQGRRRRHAVASMRGEHLLASLQAAAPRTNATSASDNISNIKQTRSPKAAAGQRRSNSPDIIFARRVQRGKGQKNSRPAGAVGAGYQQHPSRGHGCCFRNDTNPKGGSRQSTILWKRKEV